MADYSGMKVTIMGLGLNGGGLESARYLARCGAECTITDMKDESVLAPSIEELMALPGSHRSFRFVLGRHEMEDFTKADIVIKNPAVPPDSPYLSAARRIETDISLFLAASPARLIAVTGSKGKSGTSSALHWVLAKARETSPCNALKPGSRAFLGGNITVSPLSFLDQLNEDDDVVLELSSWQLGDIKGRRLPSDSSRMLLKPRSAILTSIMPDHLDRYRTMEAYINDKRLIYSGQDKKDATIACADDHWGQSFLSETPGRPLPYSSESLETGNGNIAFIDPKSGAGLIKNGDEWSEAVPQRLLVPGRHNKKNCLAAALALADMGLPAALIRESLGTFPGIEHRLEFFHKKEGIFFYNDTAATIPEAAAAAVETFTGNCISGKQESRLILVTGGTDKNLDFSPLVRTIQATRAEENAMDIVLLSGTGSDKLSALFKETGISFHGPFNNINDAAFRALELGEKAKKEAAIEAIRQSDEKTAAQITVVLSPGCTSFGMFKNEFDRGRQWKEAVRRL